MYGLTKKQKLDFILKQIAELELTSYDIGKKTNLSISGIEKIINGTSKNPQEGTLNKILEFLENKVVGMNLGKQNEVNEPSEEYKNNTPEKDLRDLIACKEKNGKLLMEVMRLQSILRQNKIDFDDTFEM